MTPLSSVLTAGRALLAFRVNIRKLRSFSLFLLPVLLLSAAPVHAVKGKAETAIREIAEAASNLISSLNEEQRDEALFTMDHDERFNWHFVPRGRNGLSIKEMMPDQRHLVQALLASTLSHRGHFKVATVMSLEQVLHELENQAPHRDPELYFVSIFGEPGPEATWGWRFEGHHLSFNFTILEGKEFSGAPSFLGSNPAEIRSGPRQGLRTLAAEEDLGRELVQSLDEEQRETAIVATSEPRDIITGADRTVDPLEPMGLAAAEMTDEQKETLLKLVREYVYRYRAELADRDMKKIEDLGVDTLHFAWAGGIEPGEGHYYRIQNAAFLMEYSNTQNNANHVHAAWRDFENDFGDDMLRRHYEQYDHSE